MADLQTGFSSDMAALESTASTDVKTTEATPDPAAALNKKIEDHFTSEMEDSERTKKTFISDWKRNVDVRLGQPVGLYTEGLDIDTDLQSALNPDWSLTKTKTANLFSQVPTIRGTHFNPRFAPAISPFLKQLNYELGPNRADVAVAMNECLNDVVNAAGVCGAIVTYSARFDDVPVPAEDPMLPAPPAPPQMGPDGQPMPPAAAPAPAMMTALRPVSDRIEMTRISPRDLIWQARFLGSDFNRADFIGHRDRCTKAVGQVEFKLTEDQLRQAAEANKADGSQDLRSSQDKVTPEDGQEIGFRELFYWRYRQDPNEKNYSAIWRLVYVDGIAKPVVHEAWKGQRYNPQTRKYVGSCKFPIQMCTLTYITDNPIPPSDSQAGRPQVNDLRRSRSQMFQNRQRSIPIRWFDVNRIDQDLQGNLMRGVVQGMIPTNGSGDRAIGEIARASYPAENLEFDQAAQADLKESWQIGPNQTGETTGGTAGEAEIVQQNFTTRIGQERSFIAKFLLNLSYVAAGFLCLYSDFPILSDEERTAMQQAWDQKQILHDLVLNIVPDSTVMLDAEQRIAKLMKVLNMTVQSGFVNPEPIIAEILELSGLDPAAIMVKPDKKADPPNLSYRFSGKDDMQNPIVLGLYLAQQEGAPLDQKHIDQAMKMLDTTIGIVKPEPPPGPGGPPPDGEEPPPNGQMPPAHPDWEQAPKIATRSREIA